ncbi:hypothetical protein F511_15748 [Dorcoceras hygrometricum]|uniref:Uncharacterized protein n=1 Tax=Dorcoceras hygrometricum TaxID=472368 RepID=A0A2Z7B066_9LAMI|nr:hypothetical protein F511_15748 [Dorcoceras hygrometricum]
METSKVESAVHNQAKAKLNQLEHDEPAETMNQLQALKRKDEPAVAIISTVDESINSRHSRSLEEAQAGAGTKKFSRKLQWNQQRASTSTVGYQQIKQSARDNATPCWRISRWISVDDVIGDVIIFSRCRKLMFTSRCYLKIAIAKRCRLHKLIRQRFALALKIQQEDFALISAVASYSGFSHNAKISSCSVGTSRRKQQQHPVESLYESAVATHPEEVAKQLTKSSKKLSKLDVNC